MLHAFVTSIGHEVTRHKDKNYKLTHTHTHTHKQISKGTSINLIIKKLLEMSTFSTDVS
jgi:hypothetical protein